MSNERNSNKRPRGDEFGTQIECSIRSNISTSVSNVNKDIQELLQCNDTTISEKELLNTMLTLQACSTDLQTCYNHELHVENEEKQHLINQVQHLENRTDQLKRTVKEKNIIIKECKEKYNTVMIENENNKHKEQSLLEQIEVLQKQVQQREDSLHAKEQQCKSLILNNMKYKQLADVFRKQKDSIQNKLNTTGTSNISSSGTSITSNNSTSSGATNNSATSNTIESSTNTTTTTIDINTATDTNTTHNTTTDSNTTTPNTTTLTPTTSNTQLLEVQLVWDKEKLILEQKLKNEQKKTEMFQGLMKEMQNISTTLNEKDEEIIKLKERIDKIQNDNNCLSEQLITAYNINNNITNKLTTIQAENLAFIEELLNTRAEKEQVSAQLVTVQNEKDLISTQFSALQVENHAFVDEILDLRAEKGEISIQFQKQLTTLHTEIESICTQFTIMKTENQTFLNLLNN